MPFARTATGDYRYSFSHYFIQNIKIKDFNVLIDGKRFFNLPVIDEEEAYEKIMSMSINNDYTTCNLFDFAYLKKKYKLSPIDLSKETDLKDPQQNSFIGKLLATRWISVFFIIEKSKETTLKFLQNCVNILQKWRRKRL